MRTVLPLITVVIVVLCAAGDVCAQFESSTPQGELLGEVESQRWQIGFLFSAPAGPCRNIMATQSVPRDWPEQKVTIVGQDVSSGVEIDYLEVGDAARQMVVKVPQLAGGAEARAVITFEVRRAFLLEPKRSEQLLLPSRAQTPLPVRRYLSASPYIESGDRSIRELAGQVVPKDGTPWNRIQAIYDWVRTNIQFVDNQGLEPVGTVKTLELKHGDCDEMSCLFIALCRSSGVPARIVQVPGHVYAEFYLADTAGDGRWYPCQLAGMRAFGAMPEHRPVLQKGDNLVSPHAGRKKYLLLPQHVTAAAGAPTVEIVVKKVDR
ncbi:MAG: transglutaminase-like domain-containing protein [Thermoguttaceae bacterium]